MIAARGLRVMGPCRSQWPGLTLSLLMNPSSGPGAFFLVKEASISFWFSLMFLNLAPMEKEQAGGQGGVFLAVEDGDLGAVDLDLEILLDVVAVVHQVYLVGRTDDRLEIADQVNAFDADVVGHEADHVQQLALHLQRNVEAGVLSFFHGFPVLMVLRHGSTKEKYFNRPPAGAC